MTVSTFDLFSIGIGPSSSHTVGPMRAAKRFLDEFQVGGSLETIVHVKVDLYGSLALTGKGHSTDLAIILGLLGETPEGCNPDRIPSIIEAVRTKRSLALLGKKTVPFDELHDLIFHKDRQLPFHPNAMRFTLYGSKGEELASKVYYSVGGGFIIEHDAVSRSQEVLHQPAGVPYPFKTAKELLQICSEKSFMIYDLMMENEKMKRSEQSVKEGIFRIWGVMQGCIDRGIQQEGILPGGLGVRRRAKTIYQQLQNEAKEGISNPSEVMDWVSLFALAVNEENAAGGRVVTAPTNGAAGVIPAVLSYYKKFINGANDEGIIRYFLTAAAIGILFKEGASISAAEMGCMGEVGVACSMAAGGLAAALGGTNLQIENAAEIGMEHNLGMTCDPIKGLVQIPCIERNTMGAIKAINACKLALRGDGIHHVSLDQVINTMRATGQDMKSIYKETSLGGLAVNVPEC
jgi:L-serine dehydratase